MKKLPLLFMFLSVALIAQTKNVFIFVVDGARYTETFGDSTHQYVPRLWNNLKPLGKLYTNFYNNGQTLTNPAHASILTGTYQTISNNGLERPTLPTLFEYFRKQTDADESKNYVILGKDKLGILNYSTYLDYGSAYGASVTTSTSQYDDKVTIQNIKDVVTTSHPKLIIVNFAQVDDAAHGGNWTLYTDAIKNIDSLIYNLYRYIEQDPIYHDSTTYFITNDHGRHTDDFANHGDGCEGCKHLMLLVVGQSTQQNVTDNSSVEQIDMAFTVGYLLGFDPLLSAGGQLVLPLQLAYFEVIVISENSILFKWSTISETNNYGFYIEKFISCINRFEVIEGSFQPGHNYSLEPQSYSWEYSTQDLAVQYRLKQVDNNGLSSYFSPFSTTSVTNNFVTADFGLEQNYPNPFNSSTVITFNLSEKQFVSLKIYNMLGSEIITLINETKNAGNHTKYFDAKNLSSGLYICRLQTNIKNSCNKLILIK